MNDKPLGCVGCPFEKSGRGFVPFVGERDAKLLVVGESLGADEVAKGEPFVGRSGWALDAAFRHARFNRRDARVGNTILCQPPRQYDAGPDWAGAIAHCRRAYTGDMVAAGRHNAVLLVGGASLLAHTGFRPIHVSRGGHRVPLNGIENARGSAWRASELAGGGAVALHGVVVISLPAWKEDPWIVPALHPAFVLRGNQHLKPLLAHDMERAVRLARGRGEGKGPTLDDIELFPSPPYGADPKGDEIAFDVETDAGNNITLTGLGYPEKWKVQVTDLHRPALTGEALKIAHNMAFDVKMIEAAGGRVEGRWFDTIVATALVQPALPRGLHDVASIYGGDGYFYWKDMPDNPRTQAVVRKRLGLGPLFTAWDRLYNAYDVWWTARVKPVLAAEMSYFKVDDLFWGVQMPLLRCLLKLERKGMLVDVEHATELRRAAKEEVDGINERVAEAVAERAGYRAAAAIDAHRASVDHLTREVAAVGAPCVDHPEFDGRTRRTKCPACHGLWNERRGVRQATRKPADRARARAKRFATRPFDPASANDWRWLIYGAAREGGLGLKSPIKTKKGEKPSVGKDAVRGLLAQAGISEEARPLLMARLRVAQLEARISKYLNPPVEADGRMHPAYALHKTLNGRTSSGLDDTDVDKPNSPYAVNAQNWPEDCRSIVIAPVGHALVNFDFSQIEAWMVALDVWRVTGSRAYFDMLSSGRDLHQMTADVVSRRLPVPVTRKQGKTARHGWNYGMGAKKLAMVRAGEGITFSMAKEIIGALRDMHPDIVEWQAGRLREVERSPTLRNPFGRVCHFTLTRAKGREGVMPDEPNEVISWWPSSTASDVAKVKWLAMDRAGLADDLVNHSHDSFTFEVPIARVDAFVVAVRRVLESPVAELRAWHPDGVAWAPKVDVQVGSNWGPRHVHDEEKPCSKPCPVRENTTGMRDYVAAVTAG